MQIPLVNNLGTVQYGKPRISIFPRLSPRLSVHEMSAKISQKQKVVVVGAGPVGALAALYAAARGDDVEVYEFRDGMCGFRHTWLKVYLSGFVDLSVRSLLYLNEVG